MNIGYIKDVSLRNNVAAYTLKMQAWEVDKIYIDKKGESVELNEMLSFVRAGDCIIIDDVHDLGKTASKFIEVASVLYGRSVTVICARQKVDTSSLIWATVLDALQVFDSMDSQVGAGRPPRRLEELDRYIAMVERHEISVLEVCKRLDIGKSTYYRRYRELR